MTQEAPPEGPGWGPRSKMTDIGTSAERSVLLRRTNRVTPTPPAADVPSGASRRNGLHSRLLDDEPARGPIFQRQVAAQPQRCR
jgi:hypothetical protein